MTAAVNRVELTPLAFLKRAARVYGHRLAVVDGDEILTYAEFARLAQRQGRAVRAVVGRGGVVAVLSPNSTSLLTAHFGVPLAGAVLVALNTRLASAEIGYILDHSETDLLLVDAEFVGTARAAIAASGREMRMVVVGVPASSIGGGAPVTECSYAEFLAEGGDGPDLEWSVTDENDIIAINYTSGTTGRPKGVEYSHRGAYLNAMGFVFHGGFDVDTKYLWTLPMFHCNGWCTAWAVTAAAGQHVVIRAVRGDAVWGAIDDFGVTHLCGAPTVLTTIADSPRAHPVDRSLSLITGGAPPSPSMIARLERLGASVTHAYGLTEVYGPFTTCEYQEHWTAFEPDERARHMAFQGVAMIQSDEVRVVDRAMRDVTADGAMQGEIVMRGNNVMIGYHRDPAATAKAFTGGWFHSGDIGVVHPDGYVEVKDRLKDIIVSGGENISSIEVENVLLSHPAVAEAAVVAVPDEHWGERPLAFVVVSDPAVEPAALGDHVRQRLAGFKVPDHIIVVDTLPHTSTGKLLKRQLREDAAAIAAPGESPPGTVGDVT